MRNYVFSVLIKLLCYIKETIEQVIVSVSSQSFEEVWKNKSCRINHIIIANSGYIELHKT